MRMRAMILPPEAPFVDAGIIPVTGWITTIQTKKLFPQGEQVRLTNKKIDRRRARQ